VRGIRLRPAATLACLAAALAIASAAIASSDAGTLDRSFGEHGKVLTRFAFRAGHPRHIFLPRATSVVIDSRNRAVGVGTANRKFALARYTKDGNLDHSFSGNGKVETQVSARHRDAYSKAYAGAIDSHGRILAAGFATAKLYSLRIALARYKPNGDLDKSFGDNGEVRTAIKGNEAWARAVAIDSEGRIVVAGIGPGDSFVLARYKPNGKLDKSFGAKGTVSTYFTDFDGAEAIAIDSRGRIVAGGYAKRDLALARYEPDGKLDPSFGDDGKVRTNFPGLAEADSVAMDSQDRIVAAVDSHQPGNAHHFALARYSEDGSLDGSFGNGGEVTTDFEGSSSVAQDVAIDARGRIIAAGRAASPGHRKFALARYLPDGELDPAFSHDGKTFTTFGSGKKVQGADGVAIDHRGRVVAAGYAGSRFALARYVGHRR
jgi:uncharacterized delta-60 repeat protein